MKYNILQDIVKDKRLVVLLKTLVVVVVVVVVGSGGVGGRAELRESRREK